ncbi:PRC-barrel domain-containing protein [Caldicellulosiruptoraceae bacterium PP1]
MNIYWSQLFSKPVYHINSNETFGKVIDILFAFYEIKYFVVQKNNIINNNNYYISVEDIESFCSEKIYFTNINKTSNDINGLCTIKEFYKKELYTEDGDFIGIIDDILIDNQSFKINSFIIVESFWDQIINSKKIILAPEDIIFKENKFII